MTYHYVSALLFLLMFVPCPGRAQGNRIQQENALSGNDWQLDRPSIGAYLGRDNHDYIEGYASLTSVNVGQTINLFVNTSYPMFTVEVFRTGYYGGTGARLMDTKPHQTGTVQSPLYTPTGDSQIPVCNWTNPITVTPQPGSVQDGGWTSGIYLARLTGEDGDGNATGDQKLHHLCGAR